LTFLPTEEAQVPRFPRPSPALFISLLALFFALGGTAFAIGEKSTPQVRCQTGAIRGIALVTGGEVGMDSLPNAYQGDDGLFSYRWSCTGGQVVVRKPVDKNGIDVEFVGNPQPSRSSSRSRTASRTPAPSPATRTVPSSSAWAARTSASPDRGSSSGTCRSRSW
jgi:hypothetical protein